MLDLTTKLLKKNPEYYTVWNQRRLVLGQLFEENRNAEQHAEPAEVSESVVLTSPPPSDNAQQVHDLLVADLSFLVALLMRYPKCYWIWNHRQWVLSSSERYLPHETTLGMWKGELELVTKMLARDSRNFHGWGYRRHVVKQLSTLSGSTYVESEWEYTSKMLRKGLQNFSALHYRSTLLRPLLDGRTADQPARKALLDEEFDMVELALVDPYNQSPWFYHNFLMSVIDADVTKAKGELPVLDLTSDELIEYYEREIARIKDMLEDFDDCKWIYQTILLYSKEVSAHGGTPSSSDDDLRSWMQSLRELDPQRSRRWNDIASSLRL